MQIVFFFIFCNDGREEMNASKSQSQTAPSIESFVFETDVGTMVLFYS